MTNTQSIYSSDGHLTYYKEHGLSPVHYDISDLQAHFDRRESLYRSVGLPPVAFKNNRVLEVAAGSGQNSLFVASCLPAEFHIVEPNPVGVADIKNAYATLPVPHTTPVIHQTLFQDFVPEKLYDIVICENWLGRLESDRVLIRKLATLVAPKGVLVMTCAPVSGFTANVLRKLMADLLVDHTMSFEQKSALTVAAFSPHLATIESMTRSHKDWVHDCMLNPHYLNTILPLDIILDEVGADMEIMSSSPNFHTDWRWFKSLHGDRRQFSAAFKKSYVENIHNFMDYQNIWNPRSMAENQVLEATCLRIHNNAIETEKNFAKGTLDPAAVCREIVATLDEAIPVLAAIDSKLADAFGEARALFAKGKFGVDDIIAMKNFGPLFGREVVYVGFVKAVR